jgi:serine/threonine protein kinase
MSASEEMPVPGPFEFALGQRIQLTGSSQTIVSRSAGGFGAVYVLESDNGKRVAVKTPRLDLPVDGGVFERFVEEVLVWIDLPRHPSILQARGVLNHQRRPYVEMEYVAPVIGDGSSVASLLATSRSSQIVNSNLVWTVASHLIGALEHLEAHEPTFVHGDIKPANLLLKQRPESAGKQASELGPHDVMPLLSDFGMSRAARFSLSRMRLGDLSYLAPELLGSGSIGTYSEPPYGAAEATKRADVYAVGCTIFELLFNHPRQLFDARTGSLAVVLGSRLDPRQLVSLRSDLNLAYAELVASCLDPNPTKRPASYGDLLFALLVAVERAGTRTSLTKIPHETPDLKEHPFGRYLIERQGLPETEAMELVFLIERSASLQALGEVSKASGLLDEAERMVPGLASIESRRASGHLVLDEPGPAKAHLQRAVSGYESDAELARADAKNCVAAYSHLAQLLSYPSSHMPKTAVSLAAKAVALEPGDAKYQAIYGLALMSAGDLVAAARAFESAEGIIPPLELVAWGRRCCDLLQQALGSAEDDYPWLPPGGDPLSDDDEQMALRMAETYAAILLTEEHLPPHP